jgi:hypothetical protein
VTTRLSGSAPPLISLVARKASGSGTVDTVEDQDEDGQQVEPEPDDEPVA